MCLEILVQIGPADFQRIGASHLQTVSGLKFRKAKFEGRSALHVSTDGTCSCGFLSDQAEFEADSWALAEHSLEPLVRMVEALAEAKVSFRFLAHWLAGERLRATATVRAADLSQDIRANKVGNNLLYEVQA